MLDKRGTLGNFPDDPRLADQVKAAAEIEIVALRTQYDGGDPSTALEAFLVLAAVEEWSRRAGTEVVVDVVRTWGSATLPVKWTADEVADARALWLAIRGSESAAERMKNPKNAEALSRALSDLLGSLWNAKTAAARLS